MIAFLVTISLTLNILAFTIMAILFLRQNKLIEMEKNLKKPMIEMEELISAYLIQMKDENDRFIQRVTSLKNVSLDVQTSSGNMSELKSNQEVQIESQPHDEALNEADRQSFQENLSFHIGRTINNHAVKAYQKQKQNPQDEAIGDFEKKSQENGMNELLIDQINHLRKQGYSNDDVAKKLNKGKTEIELLLKFQENIQE